MVFLKPGIPENVVLELQTSHFVSDLSDLMLVYGRDVIGMCKSWLRFRRELIELKEQTGLEGCGRML